MDSWKSLYGFCCHSDAQLCPTLCNPTNCSIPAFTVLTISQSILKLMSTEPVIPSNHLTLCCPLLLLKSTMNLHRPQNINTLISPRISKTQILLLLFFSLIQEWQLLLKPLNNAKCLKLPLVLCLPLNYS